MNGSLEPKSPRRSWMFTPGDSPRKMEKAATTGVDLVIMDLEDAVDMSQKAVARETVANTLRDVDFGQTECFVRTNGPGTSYFGEDLEMVTDSDVMGVVIPKVESAGVLKDIDDFLFTAERTRKRPPGFVRIFALIETALGLMNLKEIAQACSRLDGLLFGAEDLALDLGATRSQAGWEVFYGRSAVVTAAAAYHLEAVDAVFTDVRDMVGLAEDARFGRKLGYSGKMLIHPGQVTVCNQVFSPSAPEIAQARQLLAAYHTHQATGAGAFALNGRMVDRPMVRMAERLLERARLCGLLDA